MVASYELLTPPRLLAGTALGPPVQRIVMAHPGAGAPNLRVANARARGCRHAARIGEHLIAAGGMSPLDVAVEIVAIMENDIALIAGAGSGPNDVGDYEFDAFAADGYQYGTTGAVENVAHPVHVARLVYDEHEQMIVGKGAAKLARDNELPFHTHEYLEAAYHKGLEGRYGIYSPPPQCDTVGAIVAARWGDVWHIAGAGSTGGMPAKKSGRIGDTAVNGAGFRFYQRASEVRYDTSVWSPVESGSYYRLYNRVMGCEVTGWGEPSMYDLTAERYVQGMARGSFVAGVDSPSAIQGLSDTIIGGQTGWGAIMGLSISRVARGPGVRYDEREQHISQVVEPRVFSLVPHFPVACFTNVPSTKLTIRRPPFGAPNSVAERVPITTSVASTRSAASARGL